MDELRNTQYNLPIGTDCISRRKLLDKFEPWLEVHDYNDGERNVIKAVLYEIKCMPPATDTNAGTKLGTNLAEVGTDAISRQAAIDALDKRFDNIPMEQTTEILQLRRDLRQLPSTQPEIIRCKDCKYAEYIDDVQTLWCTECGQGRTVAPNDFCSYAERREVTT